MASQTRRTGIEGLAVSMARAMTDPDYEPCHGPEFQRRGICTHPDHEAVIEWLDLANDIRIVDGNHDLGAGALAEALTARGWTRRHVTAGAGTPLTAEDCAYECPFTREGHKAHDVDHEFVSAADSAGLDAAELTEARRLASYHEPVLIEQPLLRRLLAVARLSDGPGTDR